MAGPDQTKHGLLLAALAVAALYSFWYTFKSWRENRLVADTPTARIRSAAQGYVELIGHGVLPPRAENRAPLSKRACTWWRYKIEERRGQGKSRHWASIDSGVSEIPFILDDGTGQCLVDPRGAEVFPAEKDVWYGNTAWPEVRLPKGEGVLGKLVDVLTSGGAYRYTEYRMRPNEPVCALGSYHSMRGGGIDNADQAVAELLRSWKQDQRALLQRFDTNHDGTLDGAEWEAARTAARREVAQRMMGGESGSTSEPALAVLSKPADGRAFLLAASDGRSLAGRLRRQAATGLIACLASGTALVWLATHV